MIAIIRTIKWLLFATISVLAALLALLVYSCESTGVGVCVPDEIVDRSTSTEGTSATMHMCAMNFGYFYYLDVAPAPVFAHKPHIPESPTPGKAPQIRWISSTEIRIALPRGMQPFDPQKSFGDFTVSYEEQSQ